MNSSDNFAKHMVWQLTKRELRETATSSRFWIGLICVVVILAISGPFNTKRDLTLIQRTAYWGGTAVLTYFVALLAMVPVVWLGQSRNWHWLPTSVVAGICAGIPIGWIVYLINTFVATIDNGGLKDLIRLEAICIVIAIAVACLRHVVMSPLESPKNLEASGETTEAASFQKRLSPETRGDILSLQAQDHYVEVTTTRGKELILMRLSDAIAELPGTAGVRTHRSWWVARSAIASLTSTEDRLRVELTDGRSVPVSRANEKTLRSLVG